MSEERFTFPVRDDDRIMRRRRRQALRRRQVPAPGSDSAESAESSDDESPSSGATVQPQTRLPAPPISSSITSARVIPTLTAILPPAQATLLTSKSARVIPTLTAILPPAQATLLTQVTSSTSVSAPPQNGDTSIKGNRNQPPSTLSTAKPTIPAVPTIPATTSSSSSSASPSSLVSTSIIPISTSPAVVVPIGGATSTALTLTTATTFISPSSSASATANAPTPANALGETTDAQVSGVPSSNGKITPGVETVIIVVSVGAVFAVLVYVGLRFYRKLRQRKLENTTNFTNGTRSLWGGSEGSSSQGASQTAPQLAPQLAPQMTSMPTNGPLPTYIPPAARQQQAPPPESNPFADPDPRRRSALSNNAAERQDRLGRVRADLLAPRELAGGLMRSATQRGDMTEPNRGHIRSASGNNIASNASASSGVFPSERMEMPWPAARVDINSMPPKQRSDIEAGGQWDDSRTLARYSSADTERSMPQWRTPSQWVTDQAKRSQGMNRLPG